VDHAALQSQVAGCLAYAGASFTYGAETFQGSLRRVNVEDTEVEVDAQGDGFLLTYSVDALDASLSKGAVLTGPDNIRYRLIQPPSFHPVSRTVEVLIEEINPA